MFKLNPQSIGMTLNMDKKPFPPIWFVLSIGLCCLGGCGGSQDLEAVKAANDTNLKKIGSIYQLYASRSGYTGPKSKEELKSFLKTNGKIAKNLELMGIDREKIDDYFISENDGKEFDFRWGVFINPDRERSRAPLVFEKEGKDGIRLVLLSNRKILEVGDDKKYQALLKGRVTRDEAMTDSEKEELAAAAAQ